MPEQADIIPASQVTTDHEVLDEGRWKVVTRSGANTLVGGKHLTFDDSNSVYLFGYEKLVAVRPKQQKPDTHQISVELVDGWNPRCSVCGFNVYMVGWDEGNPTGEWRHLADLRKEQQKPDTLFDRLSVLFLKQLEDVGPLDESDLNKVVVDQLDVIATYMDDYSYELVAAMKAMLVDPDAARAWSRFIEALLGPRS